jgi:hypothetical protein
LGGEGGVFVVGATHNALKVAANLREIAKRAEEYATRAAVNVTGKRIKQAEYDEMQRVFDRPTPYTLRSLYFKPQTKINRTAEVGFKDDSGGTPAKYFLTPEIEGLQRSAKRFERALRYYGILPEGWYVTPLSGAPEDAYGNVPGRFFVQVMSQLRTQLYAGYESRLGGETADRAKRRKSLVRQGFRLFAIRPGQRSHLAPGIYSADLFGANLTPVFAFVQQARYSKRFHFYDVARRVHRDHYRREFTVRFRALKQRFLAQGLRP